MSTKKRGFLRTFAAVSARLFLPRWAKARSNAVYRDHATDVYPIVYTTDRRPSNVTGIARLFCRIRKGENYDHWFYDYAIPGLDYKRVHYPNGCNHSDFQFDSQFEKSIGSAVCYRMEGGGFLNNWTSSDWSFLQDDGSWRNWNTYRNPVTGKMNGFCPSHLAMRPYPPFCVAKVCFLNQYDFIMLVYENGKKTDKIRMNGYAGSAGWQRGIRDNFTYEYERFRDCKFIPAYQWLNTDYFVANTSKHNVDILRLEHFAVPTNVTPEVVIEGYSNCEWLISQTWCCQNDKGFSKNVFIAKTFENCHQDSMKSV